MDYSLDSFSDINSQLSKEQRKLVKKLPSHYSRSYVDNTTKNNALIDRIVSIVPQQASKLMPDFIGLSAPRERKAVEFVIDFDWLTVSNRLGRLANLYGAAFLLMDVDDGRSMDMPVDYSVKPAITNTYILLQENCFADSTHFDNWSLDDPTHYTITRNGTQETVHESRLLIFYGKKQAGQTLCDSGYQHLPSWVDSFPALVNYDQSLQATIDLLRDADIFIYQLKGLHKMLADAKAVDCEPGGKVTQQLVSRLRSLVDCRSLTSAMVFDADQESAQYINRDYTSIDLMVKTLRLAFAERAGLPMSVLFSSSEASLFSDSGEGDRYSLAATVNAYQRQQHVPNLKKLLKIYDFKLRGYQINFLSTVEQTQKESAETIFTLSKSLSSLVVSGILTKSQAAQYFSDTHLLTHVQLNPSEIEAANLNLQAQPTTGINTNVNGSFGDGVITADSDEALSDTE